MFMWYTWLDLTITNCNINFHVIMWLNTSYQFKYNYQFIYNYQFAMSTMICNDGSFLIKAD